ncbi:acyl CoA--acetate/3-ketoacid CoA transferase subunit alpha [Archaeoglobales archaeon ex4484_92]|nr:MAG: acyl CoA--acetate/3-ketoacid CoA transferase subunit alpha [Archaeoglobales archaeon ex4484_92]HDN74476.1 CoA transferase subunit A [Archaeoglobus sp.]
MNTTKKDKLVNPAEAVELIEDGNSITFSGVSVVRVPMVLIREIVKSGKKDLYLIDREPGLDFDLLVAAKLVRKVRFAMVGFELFGLAPNVRKAIERKEIEWLEDTCGAITNAFRAGSFGIPFIPVKGIFGSDLLNIHEKEGTWKVIRDPFDGEKIIAVKSINPDVAVIHVQKADKLGNSSIEGSKFEDVYKAKSAKKVIITAEEIVETDYFKQYPERNTIPYFYVDAVVHAPKGAYPTACPNYYPPDYDEIRRYLSASKEGKIEEYIQKWVGR